MHTVMQSFGNIMGADTTADGWFTGGFTLPWARGAKTNVKTKFHSVDILLHYEDPQGMDIAVRALQLKELSEHVWWPDPSVITIHNHTEKTFVIQAVRYDTQPLFEYYGYDIDEGFDYKLAIEEELWSCGIPTILRANDNLTIEWQGPLCSVTL